jgi:cell division transport system permease protein
VIGYAISTALRNLRSGWKLHLLTISTIATVFMVFEGGFLLFWNVRTVFLGTRGETEMTVYLKDGGEAAGREEMEKTACRASFVRHCDFRSSSEARKRFLEANPDLTSAVSTLSENPFPASLRIEIDPRFRDTQALREFTGRVSALPQVDGVEEGGEWLVQWVRLLNFVDALFVLVALALGAAAVFIVFNTIRILVHSKRDEIEILSLVGATDRTIRAPFLIEGMFQGGMGALLATAVVRLGFEYGKQYAAMHFEGLLPVDFRFLPLSAQGVAILAGILLGLVGSSLAVGRFLRS